MQEITDERHHQMRRSAWTVMLPMALAIQMACTEGVSDAGGTSNALRASLDGQPRTQVLVLATEHLRGLGETYQPSLLFTLLDALAEFRPAVIAVEALPPVEIDRLVRTSTDSASAQAQILDAFAGDAAHYGRLAQMALGLSYEEATSVTESTQTTRARPSSERRRLQAMQSLAAYDVPSALVQWSYLAAEDRVADGMVPDPVVRLLGERLNSANEIVSIGVALAHRVDLQRLASIDDHVDDEVGLATELNDALMRELEGNPAYQDLVSSSYFEEAQQRLPDAAATGDLLPLYLTINSADYLRADLAAQWHLFYRTRLESKLDRARAALWEARNLNIASRIREESAFHAGGRILVLIGAAHKLFLDQYMRQMMDVEVVQLTDLLD
jgi:hypothetical protein